MKLGYMRVSTTDQDLSRQRHALEKAGCEVIYEDTISGAKAARPGLARMLEEMKEGDTVTVQKLDRLGRSLQHLLKLVEEFNDRGIGFISLTESIDTKSASGRLLLQVMGAIAEFERALIRERVRDGLAAKKRQGVRLGRPEKDRREDQQLIEGLTYLEARDRGISRHRYYAARQRKA